MANCTSTVVDQSDIDNLLISPCPNINIQGAVGALNFTSLTNTSSITVNDSPDLESLSFPQITSLDLLEISNTTALTTVSLPLLGSDADSIPSLNIINAPSLASMDLDNATTYGDVILLGLSPTAKNNVGTNKISTANTVRIDSCLDLMDLEMAGEVEIIGTPGCDYALGKLQLVGNLTVTNAGGTSLVGANSYLFNNPYLQVNNSLILTNSTLPGDSPLSSEIEFNRVTTIGDDLAITSNSNVFINFYGLTNIAGSVYLLNNTNCTFDFDAVESIRDLYMLDNPDTMLPLFPHLRTVRNIHLRGYVNT